MNVRIVKNRFTVAILVLVFSLFIRAETHLMAILPATGQFNVALEGIKNELGPNYHIWNVDVSSDIPEASDIITQCYSRKISGLILMDMKAITLCTEMAKIDSSIRMMPKFVLMTVQADRAVVGMQNTAVIKFDVPAYSSIVAFRHVSKRDFTKVGVFYRKQFSKIVEDGTRQLEKEKISIVGVCLDCENTVSADSKYFIRKMRRSIKHMVKKDNVEVIWMLPDDVTVNSRSIEKFWLTKVKKMNIPVLVPLENLASSQIGVGIMSAAPDYDALGTQTAGQIIQVFENGRSAGEIGSEMLIGIKTTINMDVARDIGWEFQKENLNRIEKIIKQ